MIKLALGLAVVVLIAYWLLATNIDLQSERYENRLKLVQHGWFYDEKHDSWYDRSGVRHPDWAFDPWRYVKQ